MSSVTATVGAVSAPVTIAQPLNQRFTVAPQDLLTSNNRWSNFWSVAKVVSLVALATISVAVIAATTVWSPENIFFVAVVFTTALQFAGSMTSFFNEKIQHCDQQAAKYKRITEIYDDLIKKSPAQLEQLFNKNGVHRFEINQLAKVNGGLKTLASGLAHLMYTNETTAELMKQTKEHSKLARSETDLSVKRSYAYRAFLYDQAAIISRIHAAYDHGLLMQPFSQKQLSDIGSVQERELQTICLDQLYGGEDAIFRFHDKKHKPLEGALLSKSMQEVAKNPHGGATTALREISRKLFAAV